MPLEKVTRYQLIVDGDQCDDVPARRTIALTTSMGDILDCFYSHCRAAEASLRALKHDDPQRYSDNLWLDRQAFRREVCTALRYIRQLDGEIVFEAPDAVRYILRRQ